MINRRSAGFGLLWGEQRLQPLPRRIGQISSVHTNQYHDLNRVCKHALVTRVGAIERITTALVQPALIETPDIREDRRRQLTADPLSGL